MNILGIISLVFVLAIAGWWLSSSSVMAPDTPEDTSGIENALDSAREAAEQLSNVPRVEIYSGVSVPQNIEAIDLSGRGLTGSLKAEINQLTEIKSLDISSNKFTGIPAEVGQLETLQVLDISNNPVTGLPYEIGNLQNLKMLNLKGTNYAKQDLEIIKQSLPASTLILTDD